MSNNELRDEIYGRVFTIKTVSCGYDGDDAQDVTIALMAEARGTFLVGKRYRAGERALAARHKFKVPYDWAIAMRRRLEDIKVPAFPYVSMGCDGGFTELRVGGYEGGAHYRWWSCAPNGWEELDAVAGSVIALFEALCRLEEQYGDKAPELVRVCPVAGIGFAEGAGKALAELEVGDKLELVREKDNAHDGNAVAVVAGLRLGYVPRKCNADIAAMLDEGRTLEARALAIDLDGPQPRLDLAIFLKPLDY